MVDNFYKKKLTEYFKRNLRKKYPVDTLRIALMNQGYLRATVDEAAREAIKELASEAPVLKDAPQIEHEVIADEEPVIEKKSFWKKIVGFFKR
ncbi:hypothetical protein A3K82_03530 [Candidatus Pacearchaeota archaeon RBG_19FT_COMBO_34_9]|nr:MAG: hypothetical protein A3K82_03530 [Candidatus Pacearchaeota archaeon RBG_19FT_COMBO_34_9]OGJ16167.1 MAG: hypothetical protein A3K74_02985 [Candidatus Pacearchaeota archaeon RBG_13_33_26]